MKTEPRTEVGKRLASIVTPCHRTDTHTHGQPDPHGWEEAITAIEAEAVAAYRAELRAKVQALLDSPAAFPAFMGPTIRAENDIVRAVLALLDEANGE